MIGAVGTLGDVLPAVAVGREMARRGHEVKVLANPAFAGTIARAGLELVPIGRAADFERLVDHPDYWDPVRGFSWFARQAVVPSLRLMVGAIERHAAPGETLVVALNYAYGARQAAERLGLPSARLVTQPAMLEGLVGGPSRFARVIGSLESLIDFRGRTLGVTAMGAPTETVVALFPQWFLPPGTSVPLGACLTGFPLYDGDEAAVGPELDAFLGAGAPPVVLFAGSNGTRARAVVSKALAGTRALARRALVVGRDPTLPTTVAGEDALVVPFVPFGAVLPRMAAVVHHGGIGTIAQCLAAGVPQLALTANFETPENAAAMVALGVGSALPAAEVDADTLAERLHGLLDAPAVARRCAEVAARVRTDNPFPRTVEILAGLLERQG